MPVELELLLDELELLLLDELELELEELELLDELELLEEELLELEDPPLSGFCCVGSPVQAIKLKIDKQTRLFRNMT